MNKIFTAAANTSYGNNLDRRLGEGHIFKLFKGAFNWSLKKKNLTVIISITEAKLLSISYTAKTLF